MRPRGVRALALAIFFSGVTVVVSPVAVSAAAGPSQPLPTIPSVPVAEQWIQSRPQDLASKAALSGDQDPSAGTPDGQGTTRETSLSPSSTWDVSLRTGEFSWAYPLRVPPAPGGFVPSLALSYSSSSVDGHTSATNNQPGWAGDGWSLSPGFIERTYGACAGDSEGGTTPPRESGDLCWRSDNAMASYGAAAGPMIWDADRKTWRSKNDDGARIDRWTGAANGDGDGEHWRITTLDGTQYFFGSRPESKSAWTVPVFGDDVDEPCHGTTFDTSHCVQAWRWNLDRVVDPHGNEIRYDYATESNSYGFNRKDTAVSYVRNGYLLKAEYGMRAGSAPTGEVEFITDDRCVPGSTCVPDKKENWPDVAWEDNCAKATCPDRHWPSFWSTKRLKQVITRVLTPGQAPQDVDSWELEHQFPKPAGGEKAALWLRSIKHTGLVGGAVALPPVVFEGTPLPNRVDRSDGIGVLNRFRVSGVISEAGGATSIAYAPTECTATSLPTAENNTKRCFPVKWTPKFATERTDHFHKYVVDTVISSDRLAENGPDPDRPMASPEQVTRYEYLDGAAWHFTQSEFVKQDRKTWDDFRGYQRVRVHRGKPGDPSGKVTTTEHRFYRGMDGDHLPSGTRAVVVEDSLGVKRPDSDWLQGFAYENQTHNADDGEVVEKTINTPVWRGPTATRGEYNAYFVSTGKSESHTAVGSNWRVTRVETKYDDHGQPEQVEDFGDVDATDDDTCTRTTYARNAGKWLMSYPSRVEAVAVRCGATPVFPQDALSDSKVAYDGQDYDAPPTTGDVTKQKSLKERPPTGPVYADKGSATYDGYGRPLTIANALGASTTTRYEPETGGPVTKNVVTDPLGHSATTELAPAWGSALKSSDANGLTTEVKFDALGKPIEVWLPNRPRDLNSNTGNLRFSYQLRNDGPSVVTRSSINSKGNYVSVNTLYDPLQRVRQVQAPTDGGRLIVDTRYDTQGRAYKSTQPYVNDAAPDTRIWVASDAEVPGQTVTEFDGAGRPLNVIYQGGAHEKWRTTNTYGGDRVHVTPPPGGTATTTVLDARGRAVELWQYQGPRPEGDHDVTKYAYTRAGQLKSTTDPAGNTWRWTYDLMGRQVRADDVDKGTLLSTFDDADQLLTLTDARGRTLAFEYDALGRKRFQREGGVVQQEFTYDTAFLGKGKPAKAIRKIGAESYTTEVQAYGDLGLPTRSSVVVPQAEGVLRGTYTTLLGYNWDGTLASEVYPKTDAFMVREDVYHTYDDYSRPLTTRGTFGQTGTLVTDTSYTRYGEPQRTYLGAPGKQVWLSTYYETNTRRLNRTITDAEVPAPKQADITYAHDPAGRVTSISDAQPGAQDNQCFAYDHLSRLTEAWTPNGDCTTPSTQNLTGPAPYWQSFTYDPTGSRKTETQHSANGNTVRTYDNPPTGHQLPSIRTEGPNGSRLDELGYDTAGNTTRRGAQTLDWDSEGRLTTVTEPGKKTEFIYDATGNRLLRKDPTGTTLYLSGQEVRLDKATATVKTTRYYTHGGSTVAMRTPDGLTWLTGDHQGTAQIAIDAQSLTPTRRRSTPFGGTRGQAPRFPGERGFVGGTIDSSIELVTLGARQYDPATGRFLSVDPIINPEDPQQLHGYSYANNSPVTMSDPDGLEPCIANCDAAYGCWASCPNSPAPPPPPPAGGGAGSGAKKPQYPIPTGSWSNAKTRQTDLRQVMDRLKDGNDNRHTEFRAAFCAEYAFDPACEQRREGFAGLFDAATDLASFVTGAQDWVDCFEGTSIGSCGWAVLGVLPIGRFGSVGVKAAVRESATVTTANTFHRMCSFAPDTLVLMADGSAKRIDEIQVGDKVANSAPEGQKTEEHEVVEVHVTDADKDYVDLTIATADGLKTITTTADHPFYSVSKGAWIDASELEPGDQLNSPGSGRVSVDGARRYGASMRTYNLSVEAVPTYYVLAGLVPVLVHNTCPHLNFSGVPDELQPYVENVIRSVDKDGSLPSGVKHGGTRGKPGVYGGEGLPPASPNYYAETDILPTAPGGRRPDSGRLVFGVHGEVWYTGHYKDGFIQIRGPRCGC